MLDGPGGRGVGTGVPGRGVTNTRVQEAVAAGILTYEQLTELYLPIFRPCAALLRGRPARHAGIDVDLDRAMRKAVREVVDFLVEERGLTPAKALSPASIAVEFRVGEAVDLTQIVTGWIPKEILLEPWTGSFAGDSAPGP